MNTMRGETFMAFANFQDTTKVSLLISIHGSRSTLKNFDTLIHQENFFLKIYHTYSNIPLAVLSWPANMKVSTSSLISASVNPSPSSSFSHVVMRLNYRNTLHCTYPDRKQDIQKIFVFSSWLCFLWIIIHLNIKVFILDNRKVPLVVLSFSAL